MSLVRRIGLAAGPLLALAFYFALPARYSDAAGAVVEFSPSGRATLGMMAWMAAWWMTEAVEIEVTALLPVLAFPLLGILPLPETAANYASDVIFLFFGGFVLALSIQRWGLDRRLAFLTLTALGVVYGDQAIFARASTIRRVGGIPQQPIMEDAEMVRRLRQFGRFVTLPEKAVTSPRRYREKGVGRTLFANQVTTWLYLAGVSPSRLARIHRVLGGKG